PRARGDVFVGGCRGSSRGAVPGAGPVTRAVFLSHTAAPSGAELATVRLLTALREAALRAEAACGGTAACGGGAGEDSADRHDSERDGAGWVEPVRASMLLTEDGPLVELLRARGIPVTVCGN